MNGADLKRLASTANVAKLDFGEASLELVSDGNELSALYLGGFVLARASFPQAVPQFAVTVLADQFQRLVSLFPDDESIDIQPLETALVFKTSKNKQLKLRCQRTTPELLSADPEELMFNATVSSDELREEASLVANFHADEHHPQQLLTGVRVLSNGTRLGLMAYDGSTALMTSSVVPKSISGTGDVTVPAEELINGLKLLSGDVQVQATARRLYLIGPNARFDSVTFDRKWPDYLGTLASYKDYAFAITVSGADLKTILNAAKHLDSAKMFEIEADGTAISLRTMESQFGQFNVQADNNTPAKGIWRYSLNAVANVVKLGDPLTLHIPKNPEHPTHVKIGQRRCWFNSYRWGR